MKKFIILLAITLSSCMSAVKHLQVAEKHIEKAKQKGADVTSKTTYEKVNFQIEGAKTNFDLGPIVIQRKDGVVFKPVLKDTIIYKDRIKTQIKNNTVYVECPDEDKDVVVPVKTDTTIKAGKTDWQYYTGIGGGILFGIVAGILLGKLLRILRPGFPL